MRVLLVGSERKPDEFDKLRFAFQEESSSYERQEDLMQEAEGEKLLLVRDGEQMPWAFGFLAWCYF